ncbi:tetratricopeptide repeat protein [Cardiobacterium valvarum]|uniref:Tetratricopeptide repeat n=1 Tax=Cardiobacterium valvarum TaxID=194702 RepID=A0A381E1V8_9GAMM|nr:sel1 repeat family protein [Cardiobacterium valvarum]SUX19834.1 Tetratricopeptide repeat [Cardiobacterium valvarum]
MPFLLAFFIAIASVNAKEVQPSSADVARHQAELALAAGHIAEARYWYQEAIGHDGESASIGGDPALVYNLAILNYGDGVTRNLHELLDYAAASGISAADVLLGDLYESGRSGFPHDPSRAREHWQRAAAVGDNRARLRLAVDDPAMLDAAAAAGDPTALWLLASQEEQTGDAARALADYRRAAANGSTAAMTRLGLHYLSLSPPHTFAARHWLEKAAARGDSVAENYLRYLYLQQSSDSPAARTTARWLARLAVAQAKTDGDPTPPRANLIRHCEIWGGPSCIKTGDWYYRQGRYAAARYYWEKSVKADYDDTVRMLLGSMDYDAGNHAAAYRHWDNAIRHRMANEYLARAWTAWPCYPYNVPAHDKVRREWCRLAEPLLDDGTRTRYLKACEESPMASRLYISLPPIPEGCRKWVLPNSHK